VEPRVGSLKKLGGPARRMNRPEMLSRVSAQSEPWDMVIIGGGATGVGIAVDAASRGYDVLLLEQSDFGKGTSSRSTKLVHGGVRYLDQGNISLVMAAPGILMLGPQASLVTVDFKPSTSYSPGLISCLPAILSMNMAMAAACA